MVVTNIDLMFQTKSKIKKVGRNIILNVDYHELFKYKVDRNAPLLTGEPIEKLGEEQ